MTKTGKKLLIEAFIQEKSFYNLQCSKNFTFNGLLGF